ncbi:hypothetical protein TNCV_441431 [Trichonephila clavipes]|nr:hypothetical protein TNCV_441431 [Trichonephila clavipes]
MNHTFKKPLVTEFDCPRIITSTIARLRTEHLKGMKIHPDKTRSYVQCKHCPDLQLGMPNRRNKVSKNGNGPSEGLFAETPVQPWCFQNSRGSDQDFRRNLVISTAFIHGHENNNNKKFEFIKHNKSRHKKSYD